VVEAVLASASVRPADSLDIVLAADSDARASARDYIREQAA